MSDSTAEHRCPRCGSSRWVSASLDGGWTRQAQCVPCGRVHAYLGLGTKHPNYYVELRAELERGQTNG